MKKTTEVLLGGALAASIVGGLAMATPTIGAWYNVILSKGTAMGAPQHRVVTPNPPWSLRVG